MKLSPENIAVLIKYSDNIAKLPPINEAASKEARLKQGQNEWYAGADPAWLPGIKHFTKEEIDASTGSSAFAPDEEITKKVSDLSPVLLPEYHNHVPQADYVKAMEKYFRDIGIIDKSTSIKQDIYSDPNVKTSDIFSIIGAGTTQLFAASLKSVVKTKGDVIIFASPTYGLFLTPVMSAQANIEHLALTEKNHYKPNASELNNVIQEVHDKLKKQFLKTLSSKRILLNSLLVSVKKLQGFKKEILKLSSQVSTLLETHSATFTEIDETCHDYNKVLFSALSSHYSDEEAKNLVSSLEFPVCPRVRAYFHINPQMPMSTICSQAEVDQLAKVLKTYKDIIVYDDLTYFDLILPDVKTKPGAFAKSPMKEKTITLYSISKQFALAAARAGIALGAKSLIEPITHEIFETTNSPNMLTLNAVYSIMTWKKDLRTKYLAETLEDYALRRDFTLALIEGIDQNHQRYDKITTLLSDLKISKTEQKELLKGIPHLKVVLKPQSGYFILMDFSAFKGQYLGTAQLNQSRDFRNAFQALADVNTIPGELMYEFDKPILRFSYSMEPKEIVEGLLRIKSVLSLMQKKPLTSPTPLKDKRHAISFTPHFDKTMQTKERATYNGVKKGIVTEAKSLKVNLPFLKKARTHGKRRVIPSTH